MAIGTQLGFLMAGFAPSIVAALGGGGAGGWVVISIFTAVIAIIASVSALTARETKNGPTDQLGLRAEGRVPRASDRNANGPVSFERRGRSAFVALRLEAD